MLGLSIVGPEAQNKSAWASSGEVIPLQPQTWRSENTWKWVFLVHKISIFWRCTYCPNISYQCRWKDTLKSQTKIGMEVLRRRNGTTFSTPLGCSLPSKLMKLLICTLCLIRLKMAFEKFRGSWSRCFISCLVFPCDTFLCKLNVCYHYLLNIFRFCREIISVKIEFVNNFFAKTRNVQKIMKAHMNMK